MSAHITVSDDYDDESCGGGEVCSFKLFSSSAETPVPTCQLPYHERTRAVETRGMSPTSSQSSPGSPSPSATINLPEIADEESQWDEELQRAEAALTRQNTSLRNENLHLREILAALEMQHTPR